MAAFKVGVPPDVKDSHGRTIFDPAAFEILADPAIAWEYLPEPLTLVSPATTARYDALCMMGGRLAAESFGPDSRLRIVARFGVGYDNVDVPACTRNGALLTITPDGVRRPVAVTVITFMLALAQKLLLKDRLVREGRWAEKLNHIGMGTTGRTLGVIGLGNIGADVFRLAAPFGMTHLACDPVASPAQARELGVELCDLDTLLRRADFVSVNCPLSDATRKLIGAREFALMKPTAYLINTARGPIVDERALYEALAAGRIAGAGLDVFEQEPTPKDNPLLALDNVIVTPHGLCFTDECLTGLARSAFTSVVDVAHGRAPAHVVNREALQHKALAHLARAVGAARSPGATP